MKKISIILMLAGSFLLMQLNGMAQKASAQKAANTEIKTAEEAVNYLRELLFDRDFELGVVKGIELVKKFSNSVELQVWHIASLARNDQAEEAVTKAEALVEAHPDNSWSYFALARALNSHDEHGKEAVEVSEKALSMKPDHPDFLWLRAAVYYVQAKKENVIAFVDSVNASGDAHAQLLAMKGNALMSLSNDKEDAEEKRLFKEGLAVFEKVRTLDSTYTDGWYLPANYLSRRGEKEQALRLYSKAISLSTAPQVHSSYWRLIMSLDGMSSEEKQAEIIDNINALQEKRPPTPKMKFYIAGQYDELGMKEKKRVYEQTILEQYPDDVYAEWVLVNRYRDYEDKNGKQIFEEKNPERIAAYREMLWDFINRPVHNRETLIGDAYRNLFYTYREYSTVNADTLLQVVNGMVEYEDINIHITHAGGPKLLAERGLYFDRAREIAREGVGVAREKINEQREWAYDTEKEYQDAMDWYTGVMYDALGWVFFHEGKLDSAEKYLGKAYSLNNENDENLYHFGQFYEKKKNLNKAESYYREGIALQSMQTNPNKVALKNLYVKMNGSEEGYQAYLDDLQSDTEKDRKTEILAAKAENPELLPLFNLNNLKGEQISSDDLQGKIAVINIWGIWCGPCVQEMPDIQKLYEKYKDNPDVKILTINNDPSIRKVKVWMEEHEYTFPVLRDDGYLQKNEVHVFPTTWFVGKDSNIHFTKEGYTKKLVEEFGWRIKDLDK